MIDTSMLKSSSFLCCIVYGEYYTRCIENINATKQPTDIINMDYL